MFHNKLFNLTFIEFQASQSSFPIRIFFFLEVKEWQPKKKKKKEDLQKDTFT